MSKFKDLYIKFENMREYLGDDTIISELVDWLGAEDLEKFLEHVSRCHDIDL